MKKNLLLIAVWVCLFCISCGHVKNELIVCGDDKVLIIDADHSNKDSVCVVWEWKASDSFSQIPEELHQRCRNMDECKLVDNKTKILITSSSGIALLLDRETKNCLFYACVPMAHSADFLPGNRIAVALSTHEKGNSVELFDVDKSNQVLYRDSIYSGHGAVWMEEKERLFILGYNELRAYILKDWQTAKPSLFLEKSWDIPVKSGHDLVKVSENELLLTGNDGVCWFNIDEESFSPFEPLAKVEHVKAVNYDKETGRLVYTKGEISWWTHHIYSENPQQVFTIEDINLYKVRTIK
jgi:hypothetical protein